jgi:hypothetical protein
MRRLSSCLIILVSTLGLRAQSPDGSKFHLTVGLHLSIADPYRDVLASRINAKLREIADISVVHDEAGIELEIVAVPIKEYKLMAVSFVATQKSYVSDILSAYFPECQAGFKNKTVAPVMSHLDASKSILDHEVLVHDLNDSEGTATHIVAAFDVNVLEPERAFWENLKKAQSDAAAHPHPPQ